MSSPSRETLSYWLRAFFWFGNTSYTTSVKNGAFPLSILVHGLNSLRKALIRPIVRLFRGERPQMRYCLALVLYAIGAMIGLFGIRVKHPN